MRVPCGVVLLCRGEPVCLMFAHLNANSLHAPGHDAGTRTFSINVDRASQTRMPPPPCSRGVEAMQERNYTGSYTNVSEPYTASKFVCVCVL